MLSSAGFKKEDVIPRIEQLIANSNAIRLTANV